jgi:beta-lactamase superfamily II metal-dependent hydrolase
MAAAKKKKQQPVASADNNDRGRLRLRMYQVGFGDCFLLSIPRGDDHKHILIDCGVHAKGHIKDAGNVDRMTNVVANIAEVTGRKLALVIATHAHQDHISGFASEMDTFEAFEVGEVWLPWLEDPKDKKAVKLRDKRMALAETLRRHFAAKPPDQILSDIVLNATGMELGATAAAASQNAKAMDLLQSGFRSKATVRYLKADDEFNDAAGVKGLDVRVLAPPTDESFLSRMNPPKGEHFISAIAGDVAGSQPAKTGLFGQKWIAPAALFSPDERKELAERVAIPDSELALTLDKILNNTSVVGLFTFGRQCMLFPGDAQWGNWQSWLDKADDLLAPLTCYKVGHHGSVNATPKRAVEAMKSGKLVAMASTQSTPFPSIPEKELVDALRAQTAKQYVQSDWLSNKKGKLPDQFRDGRFWIDYLV